MVRRSTEGAGSDPLEETLKAEQMRVEEQIMRLSMHKAPPAGADELVDELTELAGVLLQARGLARRISRRQRTIDLPGSKVRQLLPA